MIRSLYECTFITDVVLNATAATEGNNSSLDYISGAGFLGIAAINYANFGIEAYTIFHSGKVRFGDGHLVSDGKRSLKVPASFFVEKGKKMDDGILVHHKISNSTKDKLRASGTQIKQQRKEFMVTDNKSLSIVSVSKDYAIKSAYNRETRRSEDAKMYGYEWLVAGAKWQFSVDFDVDTKHLTDQIKEALVGKRHMGRSKTAQFGLVDIRHLGEVSIGTTELTTGQEIALYAESCLAFVNECGLPTLTPTANDFGVEGTILWDKCQVLSRTFAPWNQKRFTREADRVCIDKGSVFVIKPTGNVDLNKLSSGVGLYQNEGFGRVLVNPGFLEADQDGKSALHIETKPETKQEPKNDLAKIPMQLKNQPLINFLESAAREEKSEFDILEVVQVFIQKNESVYKKIKASQWGSIRERAARANTHEKLMELLFGVYSNGQINTDSGYLTHGVAAEDWRERGRLETLKKWIENQEGNDSCKATIVLSAAMAKKCNSNRR